MERERSLFPEVAQFTGPGAGDTAREEAGAIGRACHRYFFFFFLSFVFKKIMYFLIER